MSCPSWPPTCCSWRRSTRSKQGSARVAETTFQIHVIRQSPKSDSSSDKMQTFKQDQFEVPVKVGEGWIIPPPDQCGNCFATCVACLLEIDPRTVPNFAAHPGDWWAPFQDWLACRGLVAIEVHCNEKEAYLWPLPSNVFCIVNGKSPRGDHSHSVIAKTVAVPGDGQRDHRFDYVHDPHPSNDFVTEPIRSLTFIVAQLPHSDICEHGVNDGDWCEPCNRAYKEAQVDPDNGNGEPPTQNPCE